MYATVMQTDYLTQTCSVRHSHAQAEQQTVQGFQDRNVTLQHAATNSHELVMAWRQLVPTTSTVVIMLV